ncbi:MAG: DPP IV N-terminal domain-containing protein [Bacteroidota bacterium]
MLYTHIKTCILTLAIATSALVQAQTTRTLTMDEAILMVDKNTKQSLRTKSLNQLQWLPGGTRYSYSTSGANAKIFITEVESSRVDSAITLGVINEAIKAIDAKAVFKNIPPFEWIDNDNFKVQYGVKYLNFSTSSQSFRELLVLPAKADHVEYDMARNTAAFVENDNIYVQTPQGNKQITTDGGKGIVYGQSVHRNEFGITKGLFWSPKGNKLAFYRMDESMVTDYAIYDNSSRPATVNTIKYPIAGAKSHHVTLGVYDLATGKVTYMETGEPKDQYLTNITWSPDESAVYIAIVNRGQNQMFLNRYSAEGGHIELSLIEERDDKYIEPQHGMYFLPNNPDRFIWQSEKDGFNHLYLYNTNGKLIRQLTQGKWMVTNLLGTDDAGDYVFFESTKESPLERHVYRIDMEGTNLRKLSPEQGTNVGFLNKQGSYLLNNLNSTTVPRRIVLVNIKGDQTKVLFDAPNPLTEFNLGETTIIPIVSNGTVLYSRMITPPNFDKTKKYPVIVYLYGGPHAQMVTNTWLAGSNLWMQLMAQQGYIVFTIDNRGSSNRGHEFESATFRNLGTIEMEDQMAGVNYLKKLQYVDGERMAIHGWSFGGFMTTTMMTRMPGVFSVGVAGGPVIDWGLYEIMYTERYMDTPAENPEGYANSNLLKYIDNLEDKLLMIHGCDDDVVLWQHSLSYCKAAVDNGNTNLDYFVYPGHKHNVVGKDRVHLMQKITDYIMEHL